MTQQQSEYIGVFVSDMVGQIDAIIPKGTATKEQCLAAAKEAQHLVSKWTALFRDYLTMAKPRKISAQMIDLIRVARDLSARYVVDGYEELPYEILRQGSIRLPDTTGISTSIAAMVATECIREVMTRYCEAPRAEQGVVSMIETILDAYNPDLRLPVRGLVDRIRPVGSYLSVVAEDRQDTYDMLRGYFRTHSRSWPRKWARGGS